MDNFKQECKLCDNIISDGNLKVIEDVKDSFDIHLLKLIQTLNETQAVMCMTCSSKLTAALNFKTKCLYADNTIIPYADFKNPKPIDLKQIYDKEMGSKQGGSMLEDREVCRLCLQPMSDDYKAIQEVPFDSIQIYIPEIKFEVTTNPVICIKCHDALHVHSTFIKNCLDKRRKEDTMNSGDILLNDQSLKTEEIEIKSEETEEQILYETLCNVKKEEHDEGDTPLQSQIHFAHNEGSKSLDEFDHRKQTSAQSTFANNQSDECSFESTSESRSTDHEWRHKRASEAQANKSNRNNQNSKRRCLTRGLKVQEYHCDKCPYNTTRKNNFIQHQLIHKDPSEAQMYKCDKCTFKTKHKGNLFQHCLKHRDPAEVLMFQCDECDYKSFQKGHLKRHQLMHKDPSEVRMFKCDECDYESIYKSALRIHRLIHKDPLEVQMFQCDECDHKTIRKGDLKKHQLIHKVPSEVQVFKCDECDYKSIQKIHLNRHQLRHKDLSEVQMFVCDECDYKCIQKWTLLRHQLRHKDPSEVRMFKCDACDYKSNRKHNLLTHQLKHKDPSEVRMFECDECDYKSSRKHYLKRHQLRHKNPSERRVLFKCDRRIGGR